MITTIGPLLTPPTNMPLWKLFFDKLKVSNIALGACPIFFVSPPAISPNGDKKGIKNKKTYAG